MRMVKLPKGSPNTQTRTVTQSLTPLSKVAKIYFLLQGYTILFLFNRKLLPSHIHQQIVYRLKISSTHECIKTNECKLDDCGCYPPAKLCSEKPTLHEYPDKFMSRFQWRAYKIIKDATRN